MKIVLVSSKGEPNPGSARWAVLSGTNVKTLKSDTRIDFAGLVDLIDSTNRADVDNLFGGDYPPAAFDFHAPATSPEKVICIGRNYADHAAEMGGAAPEIPVVFSKFSSAITGPECDIVLPRISTQVDYEAELVVVIGREGKNISPESAMDHVFGYTCGNDISARDWQKGKPGGQFLPGKSFDTFAPIGPCISTSDEIPDPGSLDIVMRLNGREMQRGNTQDLIFPIARLIAHVSRFFTLRPGDLMFTGTPSGVGAGRTPPVFLKQGDKLEVEIPGIGVLRNTAVDETLE